MASMTRKDGAETGSSDPHAFEPLPMIGSERRLHVRAYHYWQSRADGRAMPTLKDCEDAEQAGFAERMMLIDLTDGRRGARIRTVGKELATHIPGAFGATVPKGSRALVDEIITRLPTVSLHRAPVGFEAEAPHGEAGFCFRGILLPLSDDTGAMAHVMGVMSWREIAAPMLPDDIVAAVASVPTAPATDVAVSPWGMPVADRVVPPAPSHAERIAAARTRVALADADRILAQAHLHAAIGIAHDAVAELSREAGSTLLATIFEGRADLPQIERSIAQARLLAIDGRALATRLDVEAQGMTSFLDRVDVASAQLAKPVPVRPRFRLTSLGLELMTSPSRREERQDGFPLQAAG
jgi:hypothetical protein